MLHSYPSFCNQNEKLREMIKLNERSTKTRLHNSQQISQIQYLDI